MKIGLFGGSFDPVTNAHVKLAKSAIKHCKLDRVFFIPTGKSAYKKKKKMTSIYHRLRMLSYALEGQNMFYHGYEVRNNRISYTIKTIEYFLNEYPKDKFYLIVGKDIDKNLKGWKDNKKILKLIKVLKAGEDFPFPNTKIRSTIVRSAIKKGESIKRFVNDDVEWYIKTNRLYE